MVSAQLSEPIPRGRAFESALVLMSGVGLSAICGLVLMLPEYEQEYLTFPLVVLSISFAYSWCVPVARSELDREIDWFHPSILYVLVYFAYFIFPGVWLWLVHDYQTVWIRTSEQSVYLVNYTFLLGALSVFAFGLGARLKVGFSPVGRNAQLNIAGSLRSRNATMLIVVFLVIGLLMKIYHLSLYGPLSFDLLRYLSPAARREADISISQVYVILESMLDWSLLLAVFVYILRYLKTGVKRGWVSLVLFTLLVIVVDYIVSAKRSGVIMLVLLPFIWYHYLVSRLTFAKAFSALVVGSVLIGLLLMARIAIPLISKGLAPSEYLGDGILDIFKFYFESLEWATFEMVMASIEQREEILENAGGVLRGFFQYSFGTLIILVPRAIWPEKPGYEDLSHIYFKTIIQEESDIGLAPTLWGASYLFFDVAGLAVGMFFLGILFKAVYKALRPVGRGAYDVFFYAIFIWLSFQFLRFGTTGFLFIYFVQTQMVGVLAALYLGRNRWLHMRVSPVSMRK